MSLMYRFALLSTHGPTIPMGCSARRRKGRRLMVMLERSCDDCKNAEGAHELQGQVASFPCFGPVLPCYRGAPNYPNGRRAAPVSCVPLVAYGQITGAGLCPVSCFYPVIYRDLQASRREPHWTSPGLRHETRKCLRRRSLAAPAQRPQATRYSRSSRNGSAS